MAHMKYTTNINPADAKAGVKKYTHQVVNCHNCGRQTNLVWLSSQGGRPVYVVACSQECSDIITQKGDGDWGYYSNEVID
jgi:hypothetical protein